MEISIPYGNGFQNAVIEDEADVQIIDVPRAEVTQTAEMLIEDAMEHPIGTRRLEELVKLSDRIAILINDQTRPGPNAEILHAVMTRLLKAGVSQEQVHIVIATGTHRAPTEEELFVLLGSRYYGKIKTHAHDCMDGTHVYMGDTKSGMPVWIDRTVAEADFVIAAGLIAPHHTAGFSGGRKSIVPGVAGYETLRIHHSLPIRPYEPSMGIMEENPFHLAAVEAARKVRVGFIVNMVQDAYKQNVGCVAGDLEAAHMSGVRLSRRINSVRVPELADIVITSPGGAPRDCNLYQSQKAISVAEMFSKKDHATYILCARSEDGIGGRLLQQWLQEAKTPEEVIERFRQEGFKAGNNKAFMFARALKKGKVIVVSEYLDPEILKGMMLSWAPDLQTAIDRVHKEGQKHKIIVLPRAVNLIPVTGAY